MCNFKPSYSAGLVCWAGLDRQRLWIQGGSTEFDKQIMKGKAFRKGLQAAEFAKANL